MRSFLANLAFALVALPAFAAEPASPVPVVRYDGPIVFASSTPHKEGVKGVMQLLYDDQGFKLVTISTENELYGKNKFPSKEQVLITQQLPLKPAGDAAVSTTEESIKTYDQIAVVFKLVGPTHKWYYVFVAQSYDVGATFKGKFYKVKGEIDPIIKTLTDLSGADPEWKAVGEGALEFVEPTEPVTQ